MSRSTFKPTIYLPVEVKVREFRAKVLLSSRAAEAGYRVYLGTKPAINELIKRKRSKGGIYLYKGGKSLDDLLAIKAKTDFFAVLDEEMGPGLRNPEVSYRRRIYPGTEQLVDRLFLIGESHLDVIKRVRPQLLHCAEVTGWPRVDLWRPEFSGQHNVAIADLKRRFGNFVLFASNFSMIDITQLEAALGHLKRIETASSELGLYESGMRAAHAEFLEFIELVKCLDAEPEFPTLVIRPHPRENIAVWRRLIGNLKKVHVVYEGEISAWVLASRAVLHRGCTTALQSYMARKPTIYVVVNNAQPLVDSLPYRVSIAAASNRELINICKLALEEEGAATLPVPDVSHEVMNDAGLATDRIINSLSLLPSTPEPAHYASAVGNLLRLAVGQVKQYRRTLKAARVALPEKVPGGIHRAEVLLTLDALGQGMEVAVREKDFNLVEFDQPTP